MARAVARDRNPRPGRHVSPHQRSWSLSLPAAFKAIALIFLAAAVLHVVLRTLPELEAAPLQAMAAGTLAGLAVGGALLCFEIFSEQALRRLLIRVVPALQPNALHVKMDGGQAARLMPYLPNASIGVLTLLAWPAGPNRRPPRPAAPA